MWDPAGNLKYKIMLEVPIHFLYNSCMLDEKQMISKHVDVVIAIRALAEAHLRNNPEMSSGAVVDLLLEGIQEDVFDGWDPDAE